MNRQAKWTLAGLAAIMFIVSMAICVIIPLSMTREDTKKMDGASSGTQAIKAKEVVGSVIGGPQIVSGDPLIGYVVYIAESNTWGALHAKGSPSNLSNGARVVMYQRDKLSEWYTFLRYAQ